MRYKTFSIENYKSFVSSGILNLSPGLNVIVGPNDVGKSALLEAMSLSFSNVPHSSLSTVPYVGAPLAVVQSKATFSFSIDEVEVREIIWFQMRGEPFGIHASSNASAEDNLPLVLHALKNLTLTAHYVGGADGLSDPQLDNWPSTDRPYVALRWPVSDVQPSLASTDLLTGMPGNPVQSLLGPHFRRRLYLFRAERPAIDTADINTGRDLLPTAANLPEVLLNLQGNPAVFSRYVDYVRIVFPHITHVAARPIDRSRARILIWTNPTSLGREDLARGLSECGTGVSQVLAMLYVVVTSEYPRTILIDEPQSFLHPGAIRTLLEIFKAYPQHQYIITTHSPTALVSAGAGTIHSLEHRDGRTHITTIDPKNADHLRTLLAGLGVRLSDVFGADNILWVEGTTEEECFPRVLAAARRPDDPIRGTVILGLAHTSDFDGKRTRTALELYQRLSESGALLPPAVGFVLDRERRSAQEIEDAGKQSGGRVRFLKRRMFENYLLVPEAIAPLIATFGGAFRETVTASEEIERWLETKRSGTRYTKMDAGSGGVQDDPDWRVGVHGARLLEDLFKDLSESKVQYDKVEHGAWLTEWICANRRDEFSEIASLLRATLGLSTAAASS